MITSCDLAKSFTDEQKERSFYRMQNMMKEKMENKEPFFIGRLSGNEPNLSGRCLNRKQIQDGLIYEMINAAGTKFNSNECLKQFVAAYTKACMNCDLLGVWSGEMYNQAVLFYTFLERMNCTSKYICAQAVEPFYFLDSENYIFDKILENKKVLIITSHKETTKLQLHKKVFHTSIFHETTEFHVLKPPQQNGGNTDGQSWLTHYEKFKSDLNAVKNEFDFDIAFVSSGGFGMIICDYILKEMNKSVVYVGGGLQLYFGIMGNRWRTHPKIKNFQNEEWVNVLEEDKPEMLNKNPRLCENSCYW